MRKRILSACLLLALLLALAPTALMAGADGLVCGFEDVPAGSTFAANVQAAYDLGLMIGQTETHFGVRSNLSRLAALILACRVHSIYETGYDEIAPENGDWLTPCLAYAEEHGLKADLTSWSGAITRAEMAVLLGSALPDAALPQINEIPDDALPDVKRSDPYGADVYRLYRAGVLTGGDAAGSFRPNANLSRGAASAVATRLLEPSLRRTVTLFQSAVTETAWNGGALTRRETLVGNGDRVIFGSLTGVPEAGAVVASINVTGGTLSRCDGGDWTRTALEEGVYTDTFFVFDGADGTAWMAWTPQSWRLMESGSRAYLPDQNGFLRVTAESDGFRIELCAGAAAEGVCADFTVVEAAEPLLNWSRSGCASLWKSYANAGSGRWCFDGYYWPSPDTYVPSGENVYYPIPDAYLCRSMLALTGYDRLAYDLGGAMMDVMADRQNDIGFFPTQSESEWLSGSYGIGSGFFDTRFNTDLIDMFLDAQQTYGTERFTQVLDRYGAFYLDYTRLHHTETRSGGWLVWDYYNPSGGTQTHTSLNHQLAEALTMYHLADWSGDEKYAALADRMLLAVRDTERSWIRTDSNLHYSVDPEGRFGGNDYPYLTYNDLYAVQAYLAESKGGRDPALDRLMAAKKTWMDANGVTGYKK